MKRYGNDWRTVDFSDIEITNSDLSQISIPCDKELFQKVSYKDIGGCRLPVGDYSNYNFDEVDIRYCKFDNGLILPNDSEFFQKVKWKSIEGCTIPKGDYSEYNFDNVYIESCNFAEGAILPKDPQLFQRVRRKCLWKCELPSGDYSIYNFEGVNIERSNLIEFICKEVEKYDLSQFEELDFSTKKCNGLMTKAQANLISVRYAEKIADGTLILPKELKKQSSQDVVII